MAAQQRRFKSDTVVEVNKEFARAMPSGGESSVPAVRRPNDNGPDYAAHIDKATSYVHSQALAAMQLSSWSENLRIWR